MLYSNFKSLNKKISKVGLGCVTFGREITEDESIRLLDVAVENGINLFNTSYYYGDGISEKNLVFYNLYCRGKGIIYINIK